MTNPKRHKRDTKTLEELMFQEQAKSMNMTALQFRRQLTVHRRRAVEVGRASEQIVRTRLRLLEQTMKDFATP